MKILITGASGQLGSEVVKLLKKRKMEYLSPSRDELDITDQKIVNQYFKKNNPDMVIHCAAYTAVDKAETAKGDCYSVNVQGTKHITNACKKFDSKLVYISSDYVFDGHGSVPFTEIDAPNPVNYYGETKYQGESIVRSELEQYYIIRTSWIYSESGYNFANTMIKLSIDHEEVSVVTDQIGSPTYAFDLASYIIELITTDDYGIYHITNEGYCSWYEFCLEIYKQMDIKTNVNKVLTQDYVTKAKRPLNSRLDKSKIKEQLNIHPRSWQNALEDYLSKRNK